MGFYPRELGVLQGCGQRGLPWVLRGAHPGCGWDWGSPGPPATLWTPHLFGVSVSGVWCSGTLGFGTDGSFSELSAGAAGGVHWALGGVQGGLCLGTPAGEGRCVMSVPPRRPSPPPEEVAAGLDSPARAVEIPTGLALPLETSPRSWGASFWLHRAEGRAMGVSTPGLCLPAGSAWAVAPKTKAMAPGEGPSKLPHAWPCPGPLAGDSSSYRSPSPPTSGCIFLGGTGCGGSWETPVVCRWGPPTRSSLSRQPLPEPKGPPSLPHRHQIPCHLCQVV